MSPQKSAITLNLLAALMTPTKSPSKATPVTAGPTKVPAYQRFQKLADSGRPTLQLPHKYRCLDELFKCIDTFCAMFHNVPEDEAGGASFSKEDFLRGPFLHHKPAGATGMKSAKKK